MFQYTYNFGLLGMLDLVTQRIAGRYKPVTFRNKGEQITGYIMLKRRYAVIKTVHRMNYPSRPDEFE